MHVRAFLLVLFNLALSGFLPAQTIECPEADALYDKIVELSRQWDIKLKELKEGLFCSKCMRSKTEIERAEKQPFEKHLTDVSGKPVPATPEQIAKAEEAYQKQFENLAEQRISAQKRCDEELRRKQKEEEDRRQREAEDAARKAEEEERARQERERIERERREAEKQAFIMQEKARLQQASVARQQAYAQLLQRSGDALSGFANKVIGGASYVRSSARALWDYGASSIKSIFMDNHFEDDLLGEGMDYLDYARNWNSKDLVDLILDHPYTHKALGYGQEKDIRLVKEIGEMASGRVLDLLEEASDAIRNGDYDAGHFERAWEELSEDIRYKICRRMLILNFCD
jgi:hypothetical protein